MTVHAQALPISDAAGAGRFIAQARRYAMLDAEQEYMLAKRWREHGDTEAAHVLVTSHLRLVAKVAFGYRGYGLPMPSKALAEEDHIHLNVCVPHAIIQQCLNSKFSVGHAKFNVRRDDQEVSDTSGFIHFSPANRAKSRSVVQIVAPCSSAIAARTASMISGPEAWLSRTTSRKMSQWRSPGSRMLATGCSSQEEIAASASDEESGRSKTRRLVAILRNAHRVSHAKQT